MSYDITFWKPKPSGPVNPQATYERLNRNDPPDELEELPLPAVIEELREHFPDFDPTEEFPDVELPDGSMEISYTAKSFRFDFRPPTATGKGRLWQIMSRFGCVCYDPQTGKLYDRDNPPDYSDMGPGGGVPDLSWMLDSRKRDPLMRVETLLARSFLRASLPLLPKLLIVLFVISAILAAIVTGFIYLIRGIISLFAVSA